MKRITLLKRFGLLSAIMFANSMFSQNAKVVVDSTKTNALEEVFVTGVVNPKTKIKSSVSITTLGVKQIEQSAPRSTAEIFRSIPGIRSESTGGEGNANIAVRGVPISSGGSKYLQIQEDGLPVLLFGDIAFATADIFTRFDGNVAKVEAIRGGSALQLTCQCQFKYLVLMLIQIGVVFQALMLQKERYKQYFYHTMLE